MEDAVRVAVCPGSFDPLTNGHVEMIARAVRLFDRLIVTVLDNPSKQAWFTVDERTAMLCEVLGALRAVVGVLGEAARDDVLEGGRPVLLGADLAQGRRRRLDVLG